MNSEEYVVVTLKSAGRLDVVLALTLGIARHRAQEIIAAGVLLDGQKTTKAALKVQAGQTVSYLPLKPQPTLLKPNPHIEVETIYEDDQVLVLNKPRGLVVHTAPGHQDDTLVNYLVSRAEDFTFDAEEMAGGRPGIVHRLDKDTSGLLLVAKTPKALRILQAALKDHEVERAYVAICYGDVNEDRFTIDVPLNRPNHSDHKARPDVNGRSAVSHFVKLAYKDGFSLVDCRLETGRTHQIRAHLAYIKHAIVGDDLYASRKDSRFTKGQLLHAYKISFTHPTTKKLLTFTVPPDAYFNGALEELLGLAKIPLPV